MRPQEVLNRSTDTADVHGNAFRTNWPPSVCNSLIVTTNQKRMKCLSNSDVKRNQKVLGLCADEPNNLGSARMSSKVLAWRTNNYVGTEATSSQIIEICNLCAPLYKDGRPRIAKGLSVWSAAGINAPVSRYGLKPPSFPIAIGSSKRKTEFLNGAFSHLLLIFSSLSTSQLRTSYQWHMKL